MYSRSVYLEIEKIVKKLSKDLKRMLSALAYQDAGDYLSMHDKMQVLGYETGAGQEITASHTSR